jgi:DNA-directed RNA polymerase subunit RPC12/RpoP
MAAQSTCVKCGHYVFEMVDIEPIGSRHRYMAVQCQQCGGVAGVVNQTHVPTLIRKLGKALGVYESQLE